MATIWDNVVASASKAATQAGEATQVAATKAKLHADLLVIDRDIHARKEKFGVEMYAHLEAITSTQEFYVADDRLINVIRPTLIKAQREVAAYERKRDALKGKVNLAEANRSGTASIFGAATIGEKIMNAAKYAAAGAKEAASKTELAMIDRQILGFKEEFGVEMYPVFESMEDNEGWLPTDRKVRSMYDSAREDMAKMEKSKDEKREQIKRLDGVEGSGLTPPTVPTSLDGPKNVVASTPTVVATPVQAQPGMGQTMPWASTEPVAATSTANGYGSAQLPPPHTSYAQQQQQQSHSDGGFGFMQTTQPNDTMQHTAAMPQYSSNPPPAAMPQYSSNPPPATIQPQLQNTMQPPQHNNLGAAFDPFDGISGSTNPAAASTNPPYGDSQPNNTFDPFSGTSNQTSGNQALSDADMNLFKF